MAIKWVGASWKTALKNTPASTRNGNHYDRVYMDFRQYEYPEVAGSPTFTAVTSGANKQGSHYLSGGYGKYLLPMTTTLTLDIRATAGFAYDVVANQPLASWYYDANNYLTVYYDATADKIQVKWKDGGTERTLESEQYDDGSALTDIATVQWVTLCFDSTAGDTSGSALYVNGVSQDAVWSGAIDAKGQAYPFFEIRAENGTEGAWNIEAARLFLSYVGTAAGAANHFATVRNEEIYWAMNGTALGRTRCNVTEYVTWMNLERASERIDTGSQIANRLSLSLLSKTGEFADDQFAAFDAANSVYNGTSSQAYLTKRVPVIVESWYEDDYEPVFVGRVDSGLFQRSTPIGGVSTVSVSCIDQVGEMANRVLRKARVYDDYDLCDTASEATSLLHAITRLATEREVYNYVANSSFENGTIGDSWLVTGGTLTNEADALIGSKCAQVANATGATKKLYQIVDFTGKKKLNIGEKWTWGIWLKSAGAAAGDIRIQEYAAAVAGTATTAAYSLAGGEGWVGYEVTGTITDSGTDHLRVEVDVANTETVKADCAMLVQADRLPKWFVLNNNDGSSGEESADDADYDTYDTCGFDADSVDIAHEYVRLEKGSSVWQHLKELADASLAWYVGTDEAGTMKFRSRLKSGYADPSSIETITTEVQNVQSILENQAANKIVIRGVQVVETTGYNLWSAAQSGSWSLTEGSKLAVAVANGGTFPDVSTFGEYVARYGDRPEMKHEITTTPVPRPPKYSKANAPEVYGGVEIIGVKDATCFTRTKTCGKGASELTQTTFDTTTYGDGAIILFTNSSGSAVTVTDCVIRAGTIVLRKSGSQGYIHDSFVDYERIAVEGERVMEIGNQFIVNATQVREIADYWWKFNRGKRHIYTVTLPGTWYWVCPGEVYTLQVGGSGQREYIDSVCTCIEARTQRDASTNGNTVLVFQQLYQNWTFDSSALARFLSTGEYKSRQWTQDVTVGDQYYGGVCDWVCDGTADQVQIQAAIDYVSGALGGGTVRLLGSQFYTTAAIEMKSNVHLVGGGMGATVIEKNCNDYSIHLNGSSGTHLEDVGVAGIMFKTTDTNAKAMIYATYVDGLWIDDLHMEDGSYWFIELENCTKVSVGSSVLDANTYGGIKLMASSGRVDGITFSGEYGRTVGGSGYIGYGVYCGSDAVTVSGCLFDAVTAPADFVGVYLYGSEDCIVTGNHAEGCRAGLTYDGTFSMVKLAESGGLSSRNVISNNRVANCCGQHGGQGVIDVAGFRSTGTGNTINGNHCVDNGTMIDHGHGTAAESAPHLTGETTTTATDCSVSMLTGLKVTKTVAAGTGATWSIADGESTSDLHGLVPGTTYRVRASVRIPASGMTYSELTFGLRYYDGGSWTFTAGTPVETYDEYQELTVDVTIPSTATAAHPHLAIAAAAENNEYVNLQDISMTPLGVHNEHDQQYESVTTKNLVWGNSWQNPFAA